MRPVVSLSMIALGVAFAPAAFAAGGGGAGGGAGHQRAINSGLPPGEAGPPGAPNNRRPAAEQPLASPLHGSPRPEPKAD